MIAVDLRNTNEKAFLKLDIHHAVINAILHNNGLHNAPVLVPQVGNTQIYNLSSGPHITRFLAAVAKKR